MNYQELNAEQKNEELKNCRDLFSMYKNTGLSLDLSRGKPSKQQLNLSMGMLDVLNSRSVLDAENGMDCRNYGGLDGIPEAKKLLGDMLGVHPEDVIVGGNSSLTMMFGIISHAMIDGLLGNTPWKDIPDRKFLCPSPGYDRHFAITEHFGFNLVPVPMKADGPDMDMIEKLVAEDASIKGVWCVPKYQNPTGIVFSQEVVKRFAALKPKADDFRIFWDNAYCVHSLYPDQPDEIPDILSECKAAGKPDMVYEFCSTSKMAFPGGGISAVASSPANLIDLRNVLQYATIGPDKINQLRQVRYFKNLAGILNHMKQNADILRPKFEKVQQVLNQELGGLGIATWTNPRGGYFLSLDTLPGCATAAISLCKQAGVVFTPTGATYPYGKDPEDKNIRIAPSYATLEEIEQATKILSLCIKIASLEKMNAQ